MNSTDLNRPETEQAAVRVLLAAADHLSSTEPTAVLEAHSLLICISAEAYNQSDRRYDGEGKAASRAALAMSPERADGTTRGEYARAIWRMLEEAGYEWAADANEPAIPRVTGIPGPRAELAKAGS
ncbi:hypothetical protein OV450_1426 [Actinobacteria bacterium OV450]|nr:hypothetical protein OV450_1426 [Actinobacteria bacterium OV450]